MLTTEAPAPPGSAAEKQEEAKASEHEIAKDARNAGAQAFEFDPDASPAEKAAQAKKAAPPGLDLAKEKIHSKKASAVVTDLDDAPDEEGASLPAPTTNGGPKAPATPDTENAMTNGGFVKTAEDDWSKTGWSPRFGSLNDALGIAEGAATADHQTFIEQNLDEKFFGDWYHNAGVIIFACLSTWFVTLLGGGLGWVLIVMACCGTYYRTSIRRVRRNVRDDLNREFQKSRLDSDVESLEWMNSFVVKFWPIYQPVLAKTVIDSVDQVLAGATPGFLDSIRLSTFTLGTKPPRIEFVKTYPKTEDDIVEMDWKFSFIPNDTADLTSKQLKNKVNPKVVLEVRVGKGIASKGIPIVVEDMAFEGTMKVKIKLQINFPHVEKVDVCFLGEPFFDFALKPVGGETFGIDVGFLPGLKGFIEDQVHGNLRPMFYAPNVFTVEVAKMLGGAPIDTAIGVVAVTVHRGNGLKNPDKFSGTPDPYVSFSINNRAELTKTKTIHEDVNPRWNETKYIIISNLNDSLTMGVFDYNEFRKDKELGLASFSLDKLQDEPEQENVDVPILSNGKPRGNLSCDFRFFPVLEGRTLEDGTKEPPPESNTGVVRFTVSQAKDLDSSKSMVGQLSPYATMLLNGHRVRNTKIVKRNNNPIWEESEEMLITDRKACKLGVIIKDDREFAEDPVLGKQQIRLDDLLQMVEKGNEWFNLTDAKSGRIKMSAQWKPVAIKGIAGSGGYVTPIGVMRLHFQSAKDLRNLEAVGNSDPYVRVLLSGVQKGRTVTFENNLSPEWDEVIYVPVHSAKERLHLEVMDQEKLGKDRSLGATDLALDEFIKENAEGLYEEHSEKRNRSAPLTMDKGAPKGTLYFTAAFYPLLNVADPEDEEEQRKAAEAMEKNGSAHKRGLSDVSMDAKMDGTATKDSSDAPGKSTNTESLPAPVTMEGEEAEEAEKTEKNPPKIRLTPEELLKYQTGLLIFRIIEGQLAHKDCYLEVLMDDHMFPSYSSSRIRSKSHKFDEVGDAVVRELDFSRVTLRLREHGENKESGIIATLSGNTRDTLQQCLNNPTALTLKDKNGELSKVTVSLKYIPILMKLDPSESINNMGTLRVDILDAANLPSADRNGKSDPFCVFTLDGKKLHKTEVQKKTLHPAWNEVFETKVASRTSANFLVEIFDWDMASAADFLGKANIDLTTLEPFAPQTVVLNLVGKNGEEGKFGEIRLRMLFKPDYVTRARQGSSTFHGTFAAPGKLVTGVAGAPLKVGGFAAGGITKGASFLKKNTFGRRSTKDLDQEEVPMDSEMDQVERPKSSGSVLRATDGIDDPEVNGREGTPPSLVVEAPTTPESKSRRRSGFSPGGMSTHGRARSVSSQHSTAGGNLSGPDVGTAHFRLVSATGFPAAAKVQVSIRPTDRKKAIFESKAIKSSSGDIQYDEDFTHQCTADQQFKVIVKDSHVFGDKDLGEGLMVIDDTGSGQDTVVSVGSGKVILRTSFASAETASASSPRTSKKGLLRR